MSLLAGGGDELQHLFDLRAGKLQVVVECGAPDGGDGEQAPVPDAVGEEDFLERWQIRQVPGMHASHYIVGKLRGGGDELESGQGALETLRVAAQPIVRLFKTVQTDGDGVETSRQKLAMTRFIVQHPIGNDTPTETVLAQLPSALRQIRAQQRLAARDGNDGGVARIAFLQRLEGLQEVLEGHVGDCGRRLAVGSAVSARKVAAPGTLPKEIVQLVNLRLVFPETTEQPAPERPFVSHRVSA